MYNIRLHFQTNKPAVGKRKENRYPPLEIQYKRKLKPSTIPQSAVAEQMWENERHWVTDDFTYEVGMPSCMLYSMLYGV